MARFNMKPMIFPPIAPHKRVSGLLRLRRWAMRRLLHRRVSITFAPNWDRSSQEANTLYLPFIGSDGGAATTSSATGPLTKTERLSRINITGIGCSDYCINLEQLASTYVKSIRADQIWNTAPYPRGAGVPRGGGG